MCRPQTKPYIHGKTPHMRISKWRSVQCDADTQGSVDVESHARTVADRVGDRVWCSIQRTRNSTALNPAARPCTRWISAQR